MKIASIILAAGKGTRMNSSLPKVLHEISGFPMLEHVIIAQQDIAHATYIVVSKELNDHPHFQQLLLKYNFTPIIQEQQKGTGDALRSALLNGIQADYILMLCGDTPLITSSTLQKMSEHVINNNQAFMTHLGFKTEAPKGYGRLITDHNNTLKKITEEKDLNAQEQSITLCNSGIMICQQQGLLPLVQSISNNNASSEFYATDLVEIANTNNLICNYIIADEQEIIGVNDLSQLATADEVMQARIKHALMLQGVRIIAPETSYICADIKIGKDVVLYPNLFIGKNTVIEDGATILSFTHIESAHIGAGSSIGPFARLRPNTILETQVKIGNFVEIKNAHLAANTKASHLAYIGDATLGTSCNVGAGTIFCNYNGKKKNTSHIGNNVFIGSNSSIISPVNIGDNSLIAAGSVITQNVGEQELAIARAEQKNLKKPSKT